MTEEKNKKKENGSAPADKFLVGATTAAFGAGLLAGVLGSQQFRNQTIKLLNHQSPQGNSHQNRNANTGSGGTMAKNGSTKGTNPAPSPSLSKNKGQSQTPQNPGTKKAKSPNSASAPQPNNSPKKVQPTQPTPKAKANENKAKTPPYQNQNQSNGKANNSQAPKPVPNPQIQNKKSPSPAPSTFGSVNNKYEGRVSPTPSMSSTGSGQSQRSRTSTCCEVFSRSNENITIAIDATKDFAGGIMILPNTRKIYYYCIKWAKLFDFSKVPGNEVPEVANASIAFEIFGRYIRHYRKEHAGLGKTEITVKTSRSLGNCNGSGNSRLFSITHNKLKSMQGDWKNIKGDEHLEAAFKLSRGQTNFNVSSLSNMHTFSGINISKTDFAVVHTLAISIPNQVISS